MKFPVARQPSSCRKEIVKSIQQLPPRLSYRYDKLRLDTGNRQAEILKRSKISARAENSRACGRFSYRKENCLRSLTTPPPPDTAYLHFVGARQQFQGAASPNCPHVRTNFRYATKFETVSRISLRKENCWNRAGCRSGTTFPAGRKSCERSRISGSPSGRLMRKLSCRQDNCRPHRLF